MNTSQPLIIDFKGNSYDDGPGIRSVVFFKGCPLDCLWCHNPESKKITAELWWDRAKCIDCGECTIICPEAAISRVNPFFIDRDFCTRCFKCVDVCPSKAMTRKGTEMSVEEIVSKVIKYKSFFDRSGGGVTLSGGEPTLHIDFISALLKRLKEEGIHTLLETAGMFDLEKFEELLLPYVDMIYYDIKFIDPLEHKRYCGVTNELILKNFLKLYEKSQSEEFVLLPRTPLIPGITDSENNIQDLAEFYNRHQIKQAVVLSNNPVWIQKFDKLGKMDLFDNEDLIRTFYDDDKKKKIKDYFSDQGIEMVFG